MKISELITKLQELKKDHGDLDCYSYDWEFCRHCELDVTISKKITLANYENIQKKILVLDAGGLIKEV